MPRVQAKKTPKRPLKVSEARRSGPKKKKSESTRTKVVTDLVSTSQRGKMAENVDKFAKSLMDPDLHYAQFPGNPFPTTVARQQITIRGNTYSADGDVSCYISNDGLTPICFSTRAALQATTGTASSMIWTQPVSPTAGSEVLVEPMQYGSNHVLFSHPVTFSNASTRPGYHFSVSVQTLTVTVNTGLGMDGSFDWWYRNGTVHTSASTSFSPSTASYNISIPIGSTAFGGSFTINNANGNAILLTTVKNPTAEITFGNHSSFTLRYAIPDRAAMQLERGRILGNKVWVKYDGGQFNNEGALAAAQFPPGVNPSMFPGDSTYAQILSSGIALKHVGHFKEGCVARYILPLAADYSLSSLPKRYGENGYTVINWSSSSTIPQPYTITSTVLVEFTTHLTFVVRSMPAFAEPNQIADAVAILNRMQQISDNPVHELISKLWDKLKIKAGKVLTSRETWYTLAELGALALV